MRQIQPFHVMAMLAAATEREQAGHPVIHLEVGEPDFPTPRKIVEAGQKALAAGRTRYTPALGLHALREKIAAHYGPHDPGAGRVIVTPGSSGALQLAFAAVLDPGDEVLLADPGYPCNANMILLAGGTPKRIPCGPRVNYQLSAEAVARHWSRKTRAVLLANPSNPTGSTVAPDELRAIVGIVESKGGVLIVDEIYHGLVYDAAIETVLASSDRAIVVNSFSKYYGMTGWRVGWMVAPTNLVPEIDKLAQNLFISAPTPAQHAAFRALDPDVKKTLEKRRTEFKRRRDYLVPALRELGFRIPRMPEGAFYVYADCSAFTRDSERFCRELLEKTDVAVTPGLDFGRHRARSHVRFSYANTMKHLSEAAGRIGRFVAAA
jgi:aspartate/methionine/tyrosine aminotransferase